MENQNYKYIDDEKIIFEFDGEIDLFEEILNDYRAQYPAMIELLKASIEKNDSSQVKITAHTLKGIVANFYANSLKDSACELEKSGMSSNLSNANDQLNEFIKINDLVLIELSGFVKDQKSELDRSA